jgi:predicted Zn-dependent protease
MALPGGFFYVNSGLILAADEEAELAGVMAHETAHVCAHHAAREMTRCQLRRRSAWSRSS